MKVIALILPRERGRKWHGSLWESYLLPLALNMYLLRKQDPLFLSVFRTCPAQRRW